MHRCEAVGQVLQQRHEGQEGGEAGGWKSGRGNMIGAGGKEKGRPFVGGLQATQECVQLQGRERGDEKS